MEKPTAEISVGWHEGMSMDDYLDIGRPSLDPVQAGLRVLGSLVVAYSTEVRPRLRLLTGRGGKKLHREY